jgi:hypothetical protein
MGGRWAASYLMAISASMVSNPKVFFDMEISSQPAGWIVMELYTDTTPHTVVIFPALYTDAKGIGHSGTNDSQFFIYTAKTEWFDSKHVGLDIMKEIKKVESSSRRITKLVDVAGRPMAWMGWLARATPLAQLGGHPHELEATASRPTTLSIYVFFLRTFLFILRMIKCGCIYLLFFFFFFFLV